MPLPLSQQGNASALQARSRLSQLLCSEARAPRDEPIAELFRCGAVARMGLEAFVVYAFLCSRYASEPLKAQDIAVATGMTEANVKQALQTLAHFQQPHATPDRSVARRVQETARQFLDRTMEAL